MKQPALYEKLCTDLDLPTSFVDKLAHRAPHTYKSYRVPKKNGGFRLISQPAKETKYLQYWLMDNVFSSLPVHDCATAYKSGASIKKNASFHQKNTFLVKYDFKSFFTSIKDIDVCRHLLKYSNVPLSGEDVVFIMNVVCRKSKGISGNRLSIGSPSSPVLSNSIMFDFDKSMSKLCTECNVVYTRYADDLTFSTQEKGMSKFIDKALKQSLRIIEYPKLRLNRSKTIHLSKKTNRRVTGITITNDGELSLGRDRKRLIRSMIFRYSENKLENEELYALQGLLAFAKDIEPKFIARLNAKYGQEALAAILSIRKPKSKDF